MIVLVPMRARLDWTRMEDLVLGLGETWTAFQQDIRMWLDSEVDDEESVSCGS